MMRLWRASNSEELSELLATCLEEIDSPRQIPACLARHPEHAGELEPLLKSAFALRKSMAPPIREQRRLEARRQFLQAAASQSWSASRYAAGRLPGPHRTPMV